VDAKKLKEWPACAERFLPRLCQGGLKSGSFRLYTEMQQQTEVQRLRQALLEDLKILDCKDAKHPLSSFGNVGCGRGETVHESRENRFATPQIPSRHIRNPKAGILAAVGSVLRMPSSSACSCIEHKIDIESVKPVPGEKTAPHSRHSEAR